MDMALHQDICSARADQLGGAKGGPFRHGFVHDIFFGKKEARLFSIGTDGSFVTNQNGGSNIPFCCHLDCVQDRWICGRRHSHTFHRIILYRR